MHSETKPPPPVVYGGEGAATALATAKAPRGYSRSRQMVEFLRREFIYTEKRARDFLFREIESLLGGSGPLPMAKLTREAAARAGQCAEQAGYGFSIWDTAARATVNAMLGARVLLACDTQPIPLTVAARATPVAGLAQDYRDVTEAYLLELLIRGLGDVTARDHTALAHALFRQFDRSVPMGDLEDRVVCLLARLSERVAVTEGGAYVALANPN
jgi:hypothetical protein